MCSVKMWHRKKKDEGKRRNRAETKAREEVLLNAVKLQTSSPAREAVGAGKKNFRPQHVISLALPS